MKYEPGWGRRRLRFFILLGLFVMAVAANQPPGAPREWRTPEPEASKKPARPHEADWIGPAFMGLILSPFYIIAGAVVVTCAGAYALRKR